MSTWRERITAGLTRHDANDSQNWCRCAVAEQRANGMPIQVVEPGCLDAPVDAELYQLGMAFDLAVKDLNANEAERLLDAIEDRALELKQAAAEGPEEPGR